MKTPSGQGFRALVALGAVALGVPTSAVAQEPDPTDSTQRTLWAEHWPEFSAWEGVLTTAAVVGTTVLFLVGPADRPRWSGGILFDDAVRDELRAGDASTRHALRSVGDMTYYSAPLIPLVVDVLLVSLLIRQDTKLAGNLALISLEAFAYSGFLSFVSTSISARDRPYATQCVRDNGGDETGCNPTGRTESLWSGHTSIAATSAGLVCASHIYMPLWGSPVADGVACGMAIATAFTTGVTRIIADRHYATDVIVGTGIGFGIGYAVPALLHYRGGHALPVFVAPALSDSEAGVTASGVW